MDCQQKRKTNIIRLCVTAIMIALASVLSLVKIWHMPLGGSITLLSNLPIVMLSLMYGVKWGLASAFMSSVIQLIFGITLDGLLGWGLTPQILVGAIIFDYLLAYTVVGLAGIFRKKGNVMLCVGVALAMLLRFLSHFISGCVFFQSFEIFNNPYIYSLCYNGFYMLPELILTVIGVALCTRVPTIKKLFV